VDDHHGVLTSLHGVTWVVYKKMECVEWSKVGSWTHTVDDCEGDRQARPTESSFDAETDSTRRTDIHRSHLQGSIRGWSHSRSKEWYRRG